MYLLQNTINFCLPFVQYAPLTAGFGFEPATTIANMVRDIFFSPPLVWGWNRNENSLYSTAATVQDYTIAITDFGFLEKVSLTDVSGNTWEVKDIYNTNVLTKTSNTADSCARPNAVAVIRSTPGVNITIRFMSVPDQAYVINLTYQKSSVSFGPYTVNSVASAIAGNTVYTGIFDPAAFPVNAVATMGGFKTNAVNNGNYLVVAATATALTLANASGIAETASAYVINGSWSPIPDYYCDVYNNLFLAEALASQDDTRSQVYRQRGVAALLAKSEGLTDMQKNAFIQQILNQGRESTAVTLKLQQSTQGRGV